MGHLKMGVQIDLLAFTNLASRKLVAIAFYYNTAASTKDLSREVCDLNIVDTSSEVEFGGGFKDQPSCVFWQMSRLFLI